MPRAYAELRVCERFGWTWDELLSTPADVVTRIFELFGAEAKAQEVNEARARARRS